jgi:hypothetical protein
VTSLTDKTAPDIMVLVPVCLPDGVAINEVIGIKDDTLYTLRICGPLRPMGSPDQQSRGCICPPTAEATCQGLGCPRRGWKFP